MTAIAAHVDGAVRCLLLFCLGCMGHTAPQVAEALQACQINFGHHTIMHAQTSGHPGDS